MAGVKRITQQTFDSVVQENMEEFGMERREAIDDAVAQFKSQVLITLLIQIIVS